MLIPAFGKLDRASRAAGQAKWVVYLLIWPFRYKTTAPAVAAGPSAGYRRGQREYYRVTCKIGRVRRRG